MRFELPANTMTADTSLSYCRGHSQVCNTSGCQDRVAHNSSFRHKESALQLSFYSILFLPLPKHALSNSCPRKNAEGCYQTLWI